MGIGEAEGALEVFNSIAVDFQCLKNPITALKAVHTLRYDSAGAFPRGPFRYSLQRSGSEPGSDLVLGSTIE